MMSKSLGLLLSGTMIALAACMGVTLMTSPAAGQTVPGQLSCLPGQQRLQVTHGVADNFDPSNGVEQTLPSAGLLAHYFPNNGVAANGSTPSGSQYDSQQVDQLFVDTFDFGLPANATVRALQISGEFQAADMNATQQNDKIVFLQSAPAGSSGFTPFIPFAHSANFTGPMVWNVDDNAIDPTPNGWSTQLATGSNVLAGITDNGFVDISVQDDTAVDYFTVELCYDISGSSIDIEMTKTAVQEQAQQGDQVDFDFDFSVHSGVLEAGDQLTVTDQMPRGFRPVDLPRFEDGDDWNCRVTDRPARPSPVGREITCTSAANLTSISPFTISTVRSGRRIGDYENCADLTVIRANGAGDSDTSNNINRCDSVTVVNPPVCHLSIHGSSQNSNVILGGNIDASFEISNTGGLTCNTVRVHTFVMVPGPAMDEVWFSNSLNMEAQSQPANAWEIGQLLPGFLGARSPGHDLLWLHPSLQPGYNGNPVANPGLTAGAAIQFDATVPMHAFAPSGVPLQNGFLLCALTVEDPNEYSALANALLAEISPNRPSPLSFAVWAVDINTALVSSGESQISCLGYDV